MNSVLQCILASPLVLDLLRSRTNIDSPTEGKLAETLINIAESRKEGQINREDLEMLKKYVSRYNERFVGYKQEDAAEFLSTLITGVGKQNILKFIHFLGIYFYLKLKNDTMTIYSIHCLFGNKASKIWKFSIVILQYYIF